MKPAGYIVTKGGRPCARVPIPAARSGVLILGGPVHLFADEAAAERAILLTVNRTSQLQGTALATDAKAKKRAQQDLRLFAVLPVAAVAPAELGRAKEGVRP